MSHAADVVSILKLHKHTLATAESCTGGLISGEITNVPGASEVFLGGVVSYANAAKESLLGVSYETLTEQGAVSEAAALAMAAGARRALHADYGVSVTGIAGPSGGTPDKPVGLVWIAVAGPTRARARAYRFDGNRDAVREETVEAALAQLLEEISG